MGERYACGLTITAVSSLNGSQGVAAAGDLNATTDVRPAIYDILFSHGSAAGDTVIRWEITRGTTASTGTPASENNLDLAGVASIGTCLEELSAGGTIQADTQVLDFFLNQRATFRWVAAPGGELKISATALAKFIINPSSATYTGIASAIIHCD